MKIPGDSSLSNAEIVAFVDLAAADLVPGWKPSDYIDEDSLVAAYRGHRHGDAELYDRITGNKFFAQIVMTAKELTTRYTATALGVNIDELLGEDGREAMSSFLMLRMSEVAQHVKGWEPTEQLGMYQVDGFLLGWLMRERMAGDA